MLDSKPLPFIGNYLGGSYKGCGHVRISSRRISEPVVESSILLSHLSAAKDLCISQASPEGTGK